MIRPKILLHREGGVPVGGGGRSLNQVVKSGRVVGLPSLTTYNSQLTTPLASNHSSPHSKHPLCPQQTPANLWAHANNLRGYSK